MKSELELLDSFRAWRVDKISPTTYHADLKGMPPQLAGLIRGGMLYRCRIGRGPYYWGTTVATAVEAAVTAENDKNAKGA